jgi:hypothetical protein
LVVGSGVGVVSGDGCGVGVGVGSTGVGSNTGASSTCVILASSKVTIVPSVKRAPVLSLPTNGPLTA